MDNDNIEIYEYKHPSYELCKRDYYLNAENHLSLRKFYFDNDLGYFNHNDDSKEEVSLLFAGDLLCLEKMLESYHIKDGYDFSLCFKYVKPLLKSADFVVGNLETAISHTAPYRGEILTHEGPFYCNAPLQYLEALSDAGFDMLTTANNHTIDAGVRGMFETIDNVNKLGIIQTGTFKHKTDKFVIVDVYGFKIGLTAFSTSYNSMELNLTKKGKDELLNTYSDEEAKVIYQQMKDNGAEITICFPHWGKEYTDIITAKQEAAAKKLTSIGYDFVIGSHAHVIQKFEVINQKPVLYSLGNLITHLNNSKSNINAEYTVLYSLKLKRESDQSISSSIEFIPCKILKNCQKIPYTVVPVNKNMTYSDKLLKRLEGTVENVEKLLFSKDAKINLDFPIEPKEIEEFEQKEQHLDKDLSLLLPLKKKPRKKIEMEIPKRHFWDKFDSYEVKNNFIYCCYKDYAELKYFTRVSDVVRISEEVNGKKVKVINNEIDGNSTTRIVYLPKYAEVIGKNAFKDFTALESIRCFKYLKEIKASAFENCIQLTGVIIPDAVEKIEKNAFLGCSRLLSIKIPNKVSYIGKNAFKECHKLTIYCKKGSYAESYAIKNKISVKYMPLGG